MCVVHATSQVRVADGHAVASLVLVSCEDVQLKPEGNPAKAHSELESCLQSCPIPTDSLLPAKLTSLEQHPHYGFQSEGRTGQRVLALLESSEKSSTITMPGGYAVETAGVKDVLGDPAATVTLTSFCTMEAVAQFRLDPPRGQSRQTSRVLFALVTGQAGDPNQKEKKYMVDNVWLLDPSQQEPAKILFQDLLQWAERIKGSATSSKRRVSFDRSPYDVKKCRSLGRYPTMD